MKPGKDDLVRVQSEGELRAGLAAWTSLCRKCRRSHMRILVGRPSARECRDCGRKGWRTSGGCGEQACFCRAIPEGRLYRLKDDAESSEQQRTKQRERVE